MSLSSASSSAEGAGGQAFTVRVSNLESIGPDTSSVDLIQHGKSETTWQARVIDPASPWIAVVFPDGQLHRHQELTGIAANK